MAVGQDSLTACVGDTIFLNASGADEYEWFHDASLSCDTCSAPYIILTDTSTYVVVKGTSSLVVFPRWQLMEIFRAGIRAF